MLWIVILFINFSNVLGNHYETLGISRSATDYDIKKAYKKLARIWHPDKSRSPGASEKFMKINEAYEILSDQEKRKEYDAFGTVSNEPRGNNGFQSNHFWTSNFRNAFFETEDDTRDNHFENVDYRHYKVNIFPESKTKPALILLVTHFCMACHQAIRLWRNLAEQITDSGIKIAISDVMRDSRLREELKIHYAPSVVFIIDGQVKYMQTDINKEAIIEFIRQSFPRNLVQMIYNEDDLNKFHNLWMKDSRSKMLMTKPLDRASFRFLSLAFKYRDKISAGFIYLDDKEKKKLNAIIDAYHLDYEKETLIIFNDEKENYERILLPKPVAKISQSRLIINEMEYLIEANHQLPLSRLLSQPVFDKACPPPSQKQRSYGFCVIAVVHSKHGHNLSEVDNWQYLRSLVDDRSRGKMLYLYGDIQLSFLRSLHLFDQSTSDVDAFINQVILLWRQSYGSAASIFLSNPWEYPNLDWVLRNWNLLSNLDTAVPILTTKNRMQSKFADSETLSELVDELAAPLIWRIFDRMIFYMNHVALFLYENLLDPFTLIIIFMALIFLSYSYSTIKAVSRHIAEEDKKHSKMSSHDSSEKSQEVRPLIHELTPDLYKVILNNSQPGKIFIVLLTTELTPAHSKEIIINSIAKLKCKTPLEPLLLKIDQYVNWLSTLLGSIKDADDQKQVISILSSLSINRPIPEEGTVFALNINRNYLLICPINLLLGSPFPYPETKNQLHSNVKRRRSLLVAASSYYIDSESSDSDYDNALARKDDCYVENKFFDWLCLLMDGTCKRYHLSRWPIHL